MTGIKALSIKDKKARFTALDNWFTATLRFCRRCGRDSTTILCPRCAEKSPKRQSIF